MEEVKILICGNEKNQDIINATKKLNSEFDLNLTVKDCSKSNHIQNSEYFFSLINDIHYFNALILNYERKEDIFDFFKSFNSEKWGITNECYPFFLISEQTLSRKEVKKYIKELNDEKADEYKIKFGNILFYNEIKKKNEGKESLQEKILNIHNCYNQDNKCYDDYKESINILIIGVKNSGKSTLINRLLGETRALSMENHYTTKLNSYKHKKYPIVFYDISGFNENEDNEIRNLYSKIEEFNKNYLKIKNKIHAVFYVIDCNSVRVLQNKEKKVIENIFKINIPIFIVGQKAQKTNIKNFIRKVKFDLDTFSNDYNKKIETLKDRIICLDSSKESVLSLLESVYDEFLSSKKINVEIIKTYSTLKNEELNNRNFADYEIIGHSYEEEKIIEQIFQSVKKSIFFNNFIEILKEVSDNIAKIKEKYTSESYYFSTPDIQKINEDIEKEFLKLFDEKDLNEIKKLIIEQQNDLTDKGKDIEIPNIKFIGSGVGVAGSIMTAVCSSNVFFLGIGVPILIFDFYLLNDKNNKAKSIISKGIDSSYKRFKEKYLLMNIYLINEKAEIYNNIIEDFKKYIKEFKEVY